MFKILGAKNCRKNLHKHPSPPLKIRGEPGSFSNAGYLLSLGIFLFASAWGNLGLQILSLFELSGEMPCLKN